MSFALRLLINAAALWVAIEIVPGVSYSGGWMPFVFLALLFGVINSTLRPLAKILTFPLILVTLGLFALVVNGLMFWLVGAIAAALAIDFRVGGFWAAFWGALVVSIVSTLLSIFFRKELRPHGRHVGD
jgi:putative membrane protein